jgi:predicted secreted protein
MKMKKYGSMYIGIFLSTIFILTGCIDETNQDTVIDVVNENSVTLMELTAQNVVHSTAVGLGSLFKTQPPAAWPAVMQTYIQDVRFFNDSTGYFYAYDTNCTCVAHGVNEQIIGEDLSQYQDIQGNYVIQLLSEKAQTGGGFVTYYWPKPNTHGEFEKIGYVEMIPGTSYFLGTGIYTNNSIDEKVQSILTIDDSGSTITLSIGDEVNITLQDYGDGGYIWEIAEVDSSILQLQQQFDWGSTEGLVGDFGYDTWIFKTLKSGSTTLRLVNYRPWLGIENASMNFTATFTVI